MFKKIAGAAAAAPLVLAGIASAQTTTNATTSTTTPGIPNTGAGDVVLTSVVLGASALIAAGGALYLYMQRRLTSE